MVGGHNFRDMGGAVSRYGRGCFEIWEVLFRDMGGAVLWDGGRKFRDTEPTFLGCRRVPFSLQQQQSPPLTIEGNLERGGANPPSRLTSEGWPPSSSSSQQ